MTPAVLSALPMHPAPLAPALAGLPTAFTPSTTAVGGNVYLTAAVGLLPLVVSSWACSRWPPTGAPSSPW